MIIVDGNNWTRNAIMKNVSAQIETDKTSPTQVRQGQYVVWFIKSVNRYSHCMSITTVDVATNNPFFKQSNAVNRISARMISSPQSDKIGGSFGRIGSNGDGLKTAINRLMLATPGMFLPGIKCSRLRAAVIRSEPSS